MIDGYVAPKREWYFSNNRKGDSMDINVCPTTAFSLDTKSPEGPVRELNPGPLAP